MTDSLCRKRKLADSFIPCGERVCVCFALFNLYLKQSNFRYEKATIYCTCCVRANVLLCFVTTTVNSILEKKSMISV